MRILVTNDDGIESTGLHVLARAMTEHGDVVVVAPDREFSGASVAIGAIWEFVPEITRHRIDGVPEAWAVNGPPALCVMYARLGAFAGPFDLVVSGINPGANVGRSVYHSGTIGACLSGRNGGWSGVAVSQAVSGMAIEGQRTWTDVLGSQKWHVAAEVASQYVGGLVADMPSEPVIVNLNVPNTELDEIQGWAIGEVGRLPPRAMSSVALVPTEDPDRFGLDIQWGDLIDLPDHTDGGLIENNRVSVTYLSRLDGEHRDDMAKAEAALDGLIDRG